MTCRWAHLLDVYWHSGRRQLHAQQLAKGADDKLNADPESNAVALRGSTRRFMLAAGAAAESNLRTLTQRGLTDRRHVLGATPSCPSSFEPHDLPPIRSMVNCMSEHCGD